MLWGPMSTLSTQAAHFLAQFYAERPQQPTPLARRLEQVQAEIAATGLYTHTTAELTYGAQVAWRNSARCVGRAYWPALQVRDLRHIREPAAIFAALREHLRLAYNGGQIVPLISIFGTLSGNGPQIVNDQLLRYAGYSGSPYGDPRNLPLSNFLRAQGWTLPAAPTRFDVLPLAIEVGGHVQLFEWLPEDVQEINITHSDYPALADLGLKWHALPVISNMRLSIGGLEYDLAPFNGWYLQTEIAARNLADKARYNVLPAVAAALGLETGRERSLWQDRALLELNIATLQSFDRAGVKIADHHRVSRHFEQFMEREKAAGRAVQGRWSWLIPPLSPALTPQWHRRFHEDKTVTPNFLPRPPAWQRS